MLVQDQAKEEKGNTIWAGNRETICEEIIWSRTVYHKETKESTIDT